MYEYRFKAHMHEKHVCDLSDVVLNVLVRYDKYHAKVFVVLWIKSNLVAQGRLEDILKVLHTSLRVVIRRHI